MRVGSFVYATDQGLGILAKSFYDAKVVTDVMIVRHGRHTTHEDWYPGARCIADLRAEHWRQEMRDFAAHMDIMLFFETPFHWPIIDDCRRMGVKTALMPMYECMPQRLPCQPDLFINPSHLDQLYYAYGTHIPVPISYPWRQRQRAQVFVHNAGHGGLKGRNGTKELLEAMRYVKSPAKLIIRSQEHINVGNITTHAGVEVYNGPTEYSQLFARGDVFIFPECFNGLSLPLQEARASGMLVICGDRFPMNRWLPREPLIPVQGYAKERIGPPYNEYDRAIFDPRTIAATIDKWYDKDIAAYSEQGREWAESMSWEALRPRYMAALEKLCASST